MDRLIVDVLQYSRLARSELRLAPVDVAALLRGIIETYPAFQAPEVEIRIEGALPRVLGNEAALTQCFANLLGNAVKFVAPGTRPQVRIWAEGARAAGGRQNAETGTAPLGPGAAKASGGPFIRLWFGDNGLGIEPEGRERIFKMFQRLDKAYDGTGIGLTVVRKAVEKMGGSVGLESELGRGSRFWLELRGADERRATGPEEGEHES
jgi:signal transduction histidine kinase